MIEIRTDILLACQKAFVKQKIHQSNQCQYSSLLSPQQQWCEYTTILRILHLLEMIDEIQSMSNTNYYFLVQLQYGVLFDS